MNIQRPYLWTLQSGLLMAICWNSLLPAVSLFLALVPLLLLFDSKTFNHRQLFNFAFITFLIFHLGTVWWLAVSTFFGFLFIITSNSMVMALIWSIAYKIKQNIGLMPGILSLVVFWLSFEYIHYNWELSWPFMNLGNWLGQITSWIQWYEYTGVLGGTLWILIVNVLFFYTLKNLLNKQRKRSVAFLALSTLSIVLPVIFSFSIYYNYKDSGDEKRFLIIQPNIDPYTEKYNSKLFEKQINRQFFLAKQAVTEDVDCIVFPESSFPIYLNEKQALNEKFIRHLDSGIVNNEHIAIIGGFYSYQPDNTDTLFYNTAFMQTKKLQLQLYHKSQLVIGVEKMPFQKYFRFLKDWNLDFGGYNASLSVDDNRNIFETLDKKIRIAPVICYESVYGEFISEFIKNGANCIIVITNDGWWGNTPGFKQHLIHSQIRAIECRRDVVRSANTGISCFINQKGDIVSEIEPWAEKVLKGNVYIKSQLTFYTKYGDLIGKIVITISIILLIINILAQIKRHHPNHDKQKNT